MKGPSMSAVKTLDITATTRISQEMQAELMTVLKARGGGLSVQQQEEAHGIGRWTNGKLEEIEARQWKDEAARKFLADPNMRDVKVVKLSRSMWNRCEVSKGVEDELRAALEARGGRVE